MSSSHSHRRRRRRRESPPGSPRPPDRADVWLFVTVCYWLSLLILTHLPPTSIPEAMLLAPADDKLIHGLAYFLLAGLLCRTFDAYHKRSFPGVNPPIVWYAVIFAGCLVFGYVDEETQPMVGRMAEEADWHADALGAAFGVCAHLVFEIFFVPQPERPTRRRRRRHRRHRSESEYGEGTHRSHRRRRRRRSHESEPRHPESGLAGADTVETQADAADVPETEGRHPDSTDRQRSRVPRKRRRRRRSDRGEDGESPSLR